MIENMKVSIGPNSWICVAAITDQEIETGLSNQEPLTPGFGMIFDMRKTQAVSVTTKEMLFSIDVVYISDKGKVVDIDHNVAKGNQLDPIYCRYFLEVNAGEAKGVKVGDQMQAEIVNEEDV